MTGLGAGVSGDLLALHLARVPAHRALIRSLEHRLFAREALAHPVLDIGCGDGHYAAEAFKEGIEVGIDVSWAIVAEGRANGPYGHVDVASGTHLPYRTCSFQTVVSNCVIEHVPDVDALVSEVARVLAPGGRFLFSVPNDRFTSSLMTVGWLTTNRLPGLALGYGAWWNRRAVHHHLDAPQVWRERLASRGLVVDAHTLYMSGPATRVFELAHFYAVPSMVWHRLTHRWTLRAGTVQRSLAHRWLSPYAAEDSPPDGSCSYFIAHKA